MKMGRRSPSRGHKTFNVTGAGKIAFSPQKGLCGSDEGMSVGVSWGEYGYAGGVIPTEEVIKIRDHFDQWVKEHARSATRRSFARWALDKSMGAS